MNKAYDTVPEYFDDDSLFYVNFMQEKATIIFAKFLASLLSRAAFQTDGTLFK